MDHKSPVSALLSLNGHIFSAGHVYCKVWELRMLKDIAEFSPHSKNITSLAVSGNTVISGSLDRCVKVFNGDDFTVYRSVKYPSPVCSVGVNPD